MLLLMSREGLCPYKQSIKDVRCTDALYDAEVPALAAAVAAVGLASWPLVGPLLEIKQLSSMPPMQIEEAVNLKEPVQVSK